MYKDLIFEKIIHTIQEPILVIDELERIAFCNQALEDILGITAMTVQGRNASLIIYQFIPSENNKNHIELKTINQEIKSFICETYDLINDNIKHSMGTVYIMQSLYSRSHGLEVLKLLEKDLRLLVSKLYAALDMEDTKNIYEELNSLSRLLHLQSLISNATSFNLKQPCSFTEILMDIYPRLQCSENIICHSNKQILKFSTEVLIQSLQYALQEISLSSEGDQIVLKLTLSRIHRNSIINFVSELWNIIGLHNHYNIQEKQITFVIKI